MGKTTNIQWTDSTWNPVSGCREVSPGCQNCYARDWAERFRDKGPAFPNGFDLTLRPHLLDQPLKWREPRRIFVNSMSDVFWRDIPLELVQRMFAVMAAASHHQFQVLTKRPERARHFMRRNETEVRARFLSLCGYRNLPADWPGWPLPNVWLGVSVESQEFAYRLEVLQDTLAAVRFVSFEPLLGPITDCNVEDIDWAILGGESGRGARPMSLDWVRSLIDGLDRCQVATFVKQLGSVWARENGAKHSKGGDPQEWPEWLRVRGFPTIETASSQGRLF